MNDFVLLTLPHKVKIGSRRDPAWHVLGRLPFRPYSCPGNCWKQDRYVVNPALLGFNSELFIGTCLGEVANPGTKCLSLWHLKAIQGIDWDERPVTRVQSSGCFPENLSGFLKLHHNLNFLKIFETQRKASAWKIFSLCLVHWGRSIGMRGGDSTPLCLCKTHPAGTGSGGRAASVRDLQRMSPSALSVTWCHKEQNIQFSSQTLLRVCTIVQYYK